MQKDINNLRRIYFLQLVFVFVMAAFIRVSYFEQTTYEYAIRGDGLSYVRYAHNMITYGTFSKDRDTETPVADSFWSPGYPTLVALALLVEKTGFLSGYELLMYLQVILGASTAVITLLLGRLFLSPFYAFSAAILVTVSPHLVTIGGLVLTETLSCFLVLLAVYFFSIAYRADKNSWLVMAGIFFALAYLVNPVVFFAPFFLCLAAFMLRAKYQQLTAKNGLKSILVFCLVFGLICLSWSARNAISVPVDKPSSSSRLFENLVIGSHSNFYKVLRNDYRDPNNPAILDLKSLNGSYRAFANLFIERVHADPLHYAKWYFFDKPLLLWSWSILVGSGDIYINPVIDSPYQDSILFVSSYKFMKLVHQCLFVFAIFSICFFRFSATKADDIPVFLYILLVYVSSVYVISQAEPRYSIPLRPEMYLCALFFLSRFTELLIKPFRQVEAVNTDTRRL